MASTLSTARSETFVSRVRALLLVAAGALGIGMLVGHAQLGPLALGTALEPAASSSGRAARQTASVR